MTLTTTTTTTTTTNTSSAMSGQSAHLASLPDDALLDYLAEGAANIVYKVSLPNASEPAVRDAFKGTLLRLRKKLPTTATILATQNAYDTCLAPLFPPSCLLGQNALALPADLTVNLNAALVDAPRPASRLGDVLAPESHGLLITDMSAPSGTRLVEFKPKWLLQSPSAPKNSTRCRTCALRQRRDALKIKTAMSSKQPSGPPGYCPLDIASDDRADVKRAAWRILFPKMIDQSDSQFGSSEKHLWDRFTSFLLTTDILRLLKKYQQLFDGSDALFRDQIGAQDKLNLLLSYTLRDCSIFVLIPEKDGEIIAKVGDLDLKSELKIQKWRDMEQELVDEGWYTSVGQSGCRLSR